jgi:hypothetical protein
VEAVQQLFDTVGGARERQAPVALLTNDAVNILSAYAADGTHLGDVAWRPHERRYDATGGLFLC